MRQPNLTRIICAAGMVTAFALYDWASAAPATQVKAASLSLSVDASSGQDVLTVSLRNTGNMPIVVDRELILDVGISVACDGKDVWPQGLKGPNVTREGRTIDWKTRLRPLIPGEVVTRIVRANEGFWAFYGSTPGFFSHGGARFSAFEEKVVLPRASGPRTYRVSYGRGGLSGGGFDAYTGLDYESANLFLGHLFTSIAVAGNVPEASCGRRTTTTGAALSATAFGWGEDLELSVTLTNNGDRPLIVDPDLSLFLNLSVVRIDTDEKVEGWEEYEELVPTQVKTAAPSKRSHQEWKQQMLPLLPGASVTKKLKPFKGMSTFQKQPVDPSVIHFRPIETRVTELKEEVVRYPSEGKDFQFRVTIGAFREGFRRAFAALTGLDFPEWLGHNYYEVTIRVTRPTQHSGKPPG